MITIDPALAMPAERQFTPTETLRIFGAVLRKASRALGLPPDVHGYDFASHSHEILVAAQRATPALDPDLYRLVWQLHQLFSLKQISSTQH